MHQTILRAVLIGLVAGLIAGLYHNIFTVPIIEEAIALEEQRAAAPTDAAGEEEPPLVSLGVQRIGLVIGAGILGAVFGLVFVGAYGLLRWALADTPSPASALTAAALGFWAVSYLTSLKFSFVPPGVGSEDTLVFRQGMQLLFYFLSVLGVAAVILALNEIRNSISAAHMRQRLYLVTALSYFAFVLLMFALIPSNPDPVDVPAPLLLKFNNVTLMGHLLTWAIIGAGFAWLLQRGEKSAHHAAHPHLAQ